MMNNMIFSFAHKSYEPNRNNQYISSNVFFSENSNKPQKKNNKKLHNKQVTQTKNNNKILLSFSNISTLNGSMFQRIQYATAGCGVCGGR